MIIIHMGKVYNKVANFLCSFTANKYMHFIVCMILVQLISLFIPVLYAMLIVFILGLCKEIFDNKQKDNIFDIKDLLADSLGIIIEGLILII